MRTKGEVEIPMENRLTKLEWRTHEQAEEIREVKQRADDLTKALSDIAKCLQQIKFTAFGAVTMLIMNQLGLTDTMALILSK